MLQFAPYNHALQTDPLLLCSLGLHVNHPIDIEQKLTYVQQYASTSQHYQDSKHNVGVVSHSETKVITEYWVE